MIASDQTFDLNLGEIISVGTGEHFLDVVQIRHHGDNVVLDVAKIETDVAARGDRVLLVAPLGEAFDHVGFATQETHHVEDALAGFADPLEEPGEVVFARNEYLVFDCFRFMFGVTDHRGEGIDNVVTGRDISVAGVESRG